jgi:hypothetical protein
LLSLSVSVAVVGGRGVKDSRDGSRGAAKCKKY